MKPTAKALLLCLGFALQTTSVDLFARASISDVDQKVDAVKSDTEQLLQSVSELQSQMMEREDGVILINQAMALSGSLPGDDPGFPITLTEAGSYKLSGHLVLPDLETGGIESDVDYLSIDLNGFSIQGPNVCTGSLFDNSFSCGSGNGYGIWLTGELNSIRNGNITGIGGTAIRISRNSQVVGLHLAHIGDFAIFSGIGNLIEANSISYARKGININTGSRVFNNTLANIYDDSIKSYGSASIIYRNTIVNCRYSGIHAFLGHVLVHGNSVSSCQGVGIRGKANAKDNHIFGTSYLSFDVIQTGINVCGEAICPN